MDLNGDGAIDILSGSYSRQSAEMAGLFQVLYGKPDRSFAKATVLNGSDGEPLILPMEKEDAITDRICTRPTAVDLNGDGKLDIVSGNFGGTFYFIEGAGQGNFAPQATLMMAGDEALRVDAHSDPFLVDWDRDGDLDLLSGSAAGGVFYAENTGTKTAPKFKAFAEMVAPPGHGHADGEDQISADDEHLKAPSGSTRIWVDDINGDGLLDLLIGDQTTLMMPAKDVSLADAKLKYDTWSKKQAALFESSPWNGGGEASDEAQNAFQKRYEELEAELETFVLRKNTGYVWVLHQQKPEASGK